MIYFMKFFFKYILFPLLLISVAYSQNQIKVMTYNLLNYPGTDTTLRNPHFRTILSNVQPDILVVQEITSQAGVNGFLSNVLNSMSSGYTAGLFLDGPDTDNAIFFKSSLFTFISNIPIQTALRNINEFKLVHNLTGDTLRIYSLHLKASATTSDEQKRAAEVDSLRKRTNSLPPGSNYIVVGDYNIYSSNESAYQKLLNQIGQGYFIDLFTLPGTWNQAQYSAYHTQSPRIRSFGGGSTGGMDDRFDMMLMSQAVLDAGGISYITGSYTVYGNDGNHYNDSINRPPNNVVTQAVANALHGASDHLPVIASFSINSAFVELTSFTALIEGLYNGNSMVPDTVLIELRSAASPYSIVDQTKIFLNSNGQGTGKFHIAVNGTPYYLVIKHHNSLETWSSTTQAFTSGSMSYDFTTSSAKAFGNNLKLIGSKFCVFSGDIDQDGVIGIQDLNQVYIDNIIGAGGYIPSDLNGDMFTDIDDLSKVFVNNVLGIIIKKPQ